MLKKHELLNEPSRKVKIEAEKRQQHDANRARIERNATIVGRQFAQKMEEVLVAGDDSRAIPHII